MPEYEYRCKNCQQAFAVVRSMNDSSEASCTHCGSSDAARVWGANFITAGAKGTSSAQASAGASSEACASNPSQPKSCCPCS